MFFSIQPPFLTFSHFFSLLFQWLMDVPAYRNSAMKLLGKFIRSAKALGNPLFTLSVNEHDNHLIGSLVELRAVNCFRLERATLGGTTAAMNEMRLRCLELLRPFEIDIAVVLVDRMHTVFGNLVSLCIDLK
jgi:hypothetical protein